MEDLYEQEIAHLLSHLTEATNNAPSSMYTGEHALRLMLHCVSADGDGYRLRMKNLHHDTLMVVISFIRDAFPIPDSYVEKKGPIGKELSAIGLPHMSQYVTCHKTDPITYTLDIKSMSMDQCTFIIRALFAW